MEVYITFRTNYGNKLMYPANETAKLLLSLTNRKTFSYSDISVIAKLGYKIIYDNNLEICK
jgi:hypothetical protein